MNQIEVQIEASDHLAAQRLHTRWTRRQLLAHAAVVVVGASLMLAPLPMPWAFIVGAALIGGAVGGAIGREITRWIWLPRRSRHLFHQNKAMQRPYAFEWDRDTLLCSSDAGSHRQPWGDLVRWREDERVLLIYITDALFFVVPRRSFTDAAVERSFRECLATIGAQ